MSQVKLAENQRLLKTDPEVIQVTKLIITGWPDKHTEISEIAKPYWNFRDELSILGGVVLKGNRVVVPKVMRNDVLKQIYESYLGVTRSSHQCILARHQ